MTGKNIFVDTNILVYAHDLDSGTKHETACELIKELWLSEHPPSISIQVLQELYVNLTRKNINDKEANETVKDYMQWNVIDNNSKILMNGIKEKKRWKISFWDGLIIAAAKQADVVLDYVLSSGQTNKRTGSIQVIWDDISLIK